MPKKEVCPAPEYDRKKYLLIAILVFLLIVIGFFYFICSEKESSEKIPKCLDGSFYDTCSLRKPYFCGNGILTEKASVCGCPEIFEGMEDSCTSKYHTGEKKLILNYTLRGENKYLDFVVYKGGKDYISGISKFIKYDGYEVSRRDFKLKNINEPVQRQLLLPLVTEIQNIAENKEDEIRIAISLVQNIPYRESNNPFKLTINNSINLSKYPYEVLYDFYGECEGKSELLVFLLREMGYGTALFYYPAENHETVGIKCPVQYSVDNTGFCFIETTGPSILTDDKNIYTGGIKLPPNPEIYLISEGISLPEKMYEYEDAKTILKIHEGIEKKGTISILHQSDAEKLRKKYGLIDLFY